MKTDKPFIHPSTPRRLKTEFRRARYKWHVLAKMRGVNVKYVYFLIHNGIEPSNPNIRTKLFLSRKPRAKYGSLKQKPYVEPPEYIKWWRHLTKEIRHSLMQTAWEEATNE